MPKLPKSVGDRKRGNGASPNRQKAAATKQKRADGKAKRPSSPRKRSAKPANGASRDGAAAVDFAHRPVDQARAAAAPHTAAVELNDFERGLLGDLFAVIEEHDEASAQRID